jgi:hypothetical protein
LWNRGWPWHTKPTREQLPGPVGTGRQEAHVGGELRPAQRVGPQETLEAESAATDINIVKVQPGQ